MKVVEAWSLKRLWDRQEGVVQLTAGSHRSALPVSKQTVKSCAGVPSWICPYSCAEGSPTRSDVAIVSHYDKSRCTYMNGLATCPSRPEPMSPTS